MMAIPAKIPMIKAIDHLESQEKFLVNRVKNKIPKAKGIINIKDCHIKANPTRGKEKRMLKSSLIRGSHRLGLKTLWYSREVQ